MKLEILVAFGIVFAMNSKYFFMPASSFQVGSSGSLP